MTRGRALHYGPRVLISLAVVLSAGALGVSITRRLAASLDADPVTQQPTALTTTQTTSPASQPDAPGCAACEANKRTFRVEPMFSDRVNAIRREVFDFAASEGVLTHPQAERLAQLIEPALNPDASSDDRLIALVALRAIGDGHLWSRIAASDRDGLQPVLDGALWSDGPAIHLAALRCGLAIGIVEPGVSSYGALAGADDPLDPSSPASRLIRAWAGTR